MIAYSMSGHYTREQFDRIVDFHEAYAREIGHSDDNVRACRELGMRMWLLFTPCAGSC